jgi:predicted DNA-binding transcriptional regulator YafY
MSFDERDRLTAKRDRTARFYRVVRFLEGRGDRGATPEEIAAAVGMSKRTAYRDLKAIEEELDLPIWSEEGRFGLAEGALLPAFSLTRDEAMAVFLSARLMARYAHEYDPDLGAAFQKLAEGLPPVLARHIVDTADALSQMRPAEPGRRSIIRKLTGAWAERRVVELDYRSGMYDARKRSRTARVRPYLIEPSLTTRALYLIGFDETVGAVRTFKIDRITSVAVTPERFEPPSEGAIEQSLTSAWDIISDQAPAEVRLRFSSAVADRVQETRWHPSEVVQAEPDGSLAWQATVAGIVEIRSWILGWGADVEVLGPAELRAEVGTILAAAAGRYAAGEGTRR